MFLGVLWACIGVRVFLFVLCIFLGGLFLFYCKGFSGGFYAIFVEGFGFGVYHKGPWDDVWLIGLQMQYVLSFLGSFIQENVRRFRKCYVPFSLGEKRKEETC